MSSARLVLLLTLCVLFTAPFTWAAPLPGGGQVQEYFVRQQAGEGLLITITGREAQFESRVTTIDDELVVASAVPGSRLAPLFQYVPPVGSGRQLDVQVIADLDTSRSAFEMGLSRIDIRDDRSARLAQGYQSLSFGLELPVADTAGNWSIKVNSLFNAARTFDDYGMAELSLWANFLAARITLSELGDYNATLPVVEDILSDPAIRRNADLQLATLKLRLEARLFERRAGQLAAQAGAADPVQLAAEETAMLAAQLGNLFERSEALYLSGVDFAERGLEQQALAQFDQALDLAVSIDADDLATRVRENMVAIHGALGDVAATSQVLQAIESQLAEDGADDELAQNLLAQGRILNRTYQYRAAQEALRQALQFEHNSLTRSQVSLELATASYALGDLDEAYEQAQAAVTRAENGSFRRATPALDVGQGIAIIAAVQRARGDRAALQQTRNAQRAYLESPEQQALYAWERAQDELVNGPAAGATAWLRQVRASSSTPLIEPYRQLSQLWLCRLAVDCAAGDAGSARNALERIEIPRLQVAGAWNYAAWLASSGQGAAATEAFAALMDELIFLRFSVPGVLGDFYWRRSSLLVEDALAVLRSTGSAEQHLLGLARAQWLAATADGLGLPFDPLAAGLDTEAFRALLARRELPEAGDSPAELDRELTGQLAAGRDKFRAAMPFLSLPALQRWLSSLDADEAVLAFDLKGAQAFALLGTRSGVQRIPLGPTQGFEDLPGLFSNAAERDDAAFRSLLAPWGQRLLGPLVSRLPDRVYLAASGALAAAPFEAMPVGGERPLERRQLVRLASFPAQSGPALRLNPPRSPGAFLAGEPEDFSPGFLERLAAGRELAAVMDAFRGPGLQVIQGSALLPDEFATPAMQRAGVVHLAMPARIDLSRPRSSYLELSEAMRAGGRLRETPRDIDRWRLGAYLAVMGQGEITLDVHSTAGRMPLVADLLAAGAQSVLATAWPNDDASSAAFFELFYGFLIEGQTPLQALASARRGMMDDDAPVRDWARYQLWID